MTRRRTGTRPPTVPEHLTAALDLGRHYEGWLNPPGRPCRCRHCTDPTTWDRTPTEVRR